MNSNLALKMNVTGINNNDASVKILNFLEDKKRKSVNTYKNYVRYYTEFFMFACGKEIDELNWEDIFSIDYSKVDDFKRFLLDKGDSPNYVNQKLFACKALWKKLYYINHNVDVKVFDFEEEEFEETNYAALNDKEMQELFNFMKKENYKPLTKRLFFEFLYIVGCRKNVALELTWDQIQRKTDTKNNIEVWVVKFYDKGKWVEKAINDDFYNKLLQLKTSGESSGEKVFDLNKTTFETVFDKFQSEYNLYKKDGKKVTIHSIKKASGWLVQNIFGDIKKTQSHMQHKNVDLTAKTYLVNESYCEQASYMIGKEINVDFFKNLTKEELLELIEKCGKDVQMRMYYEYTKEK